MMWIKEIFERHHVGRVVVKVGASVDEEKWMMYHVVTKNA